MSTVIIPGRISPETLDPEAFNFITSSAEDPVFIFRTRAQTVFVFHLHGDARIIRRKQGFRYNSNLTAAPHWQKISFLYAKKLGGTKRF